VTSDQPDIAGADTFAEQDCGSRLSFSP
jgi:hypothetical protein